MWVMDRPFDGRGIRERVKECKSKLEFNRPPLLSSLPQIEGGKNKNKSLCISI